MKKYWFEVGTHVYSYANSCATFRVKSIHKNDVIIKQIDNLSYRPNALGTLLYRVPKTYILREYIKTSGKYWTKQDELMAGNFVPIAN